MKRKYLIVILALFFIVAAAVSISAANYHDNGKANTSLDRNGYCNFTDSNNDGICDNCNNKSSQCNGYFVDENNDGVCDNCNNNNPSCDGSHRQDRNHSSQQASQAGNGNKHGQSVPDKNVNSGNGNKYGQSSSGSQSESGYKYGQSSSSGSGNQHGHYGNGLHTQQKLQIRDC